MAIKYSMTISNKYLLPKTIAEYNIFYVYMWTELGERKRFVYHLFLPH